MIDPTGLQLPPPTDWPAFERQMRRLFAMELGDPNTVMTGRNGQGQGGVDIVGRRLNGHGGYVGIQCKLKDELAGQTKLGRRALLDELQKAAALDPPLLEEFILVTTASDDADLQAYAREITARNVAAGGQSVHVFGWHHLRSIIGEHDTLLADYLPRPAGDQVADGVASILAGQAQTNDLLRDVLSSRETTDPASRGADATLGRAVDRANARLGGPRTRDGLDELLAIERDEWEAAGSHIRFRLLTAIAAARWELGEHEKAATLILAAAEIEPDTERSMGNLIAAHLANDDVAEAAAVGLRMVALHPDAAGGLAALVQAQDRLSPLPDPTSFLPEALRERREALIGACHVLRRRNDAEWHKLAARASARHPDDELLARMVAESVLERLAARDGVHVGARVEGTPNAEEIASATAVMTAQWREHVAMQPAALDFALALNTAQLLRMQGDDQGVIDVLREADRHPDGPPEVQTLLAVMLRGEDDREGAVEVLLRVKRTPAIGVLLAQIASGNPRLVRRVIAETDWAGAAPYDLMWRDLLDWEAASQLGDPEASDDLLQQIVDRNPRRLPPRIQQARRAPPELRPTLARAAIAIVDDQTPFAEVMHLGLLLRAEDMWSELLDLLRDRVTLDRDSDGLRWMVEALHEVNDREGLVTVLEFMAPEVADLDWYLRYCVATFFNVGDMPAARRAADRIVERHPADLARQMDWLNVARRQGDDDAVAAWMAGPVEDLDGAPAMKADLALLLANNGLTGRARSFAYRLARRHPDVQHVQERLIGVMIASGSRNDDLPRFATVAPDAVFTAIDAHGRARSYRLETDTGLPRESIDIPLDSPISLAAAGLNAGDAFELPPSLPGAEAETFTVGEVKHKHLHLMHETMATLPVRFPDSRMFQRVLIDPVAGTGMDALLAQVTRRERQVTGAIAEYHRTGLPLRILPQFLGGDVIEAYDGLRESDARFLATAGNPAARRNELSIVARTGRRGVVIDALTLELVRRFEMLDVVEAVLGEALTTQSAVDVFRQRAIELVAMPGRLAGNLTQRDGRLARNTVTAAQVEMAAAARQAALDWVEAEAGIRPAAGPKGLAARLAAEMKGVDGKDIFDDVLAAAQAGVPLLSEDRGYREIARSVNVPAAGLHAVVEHAADRGLIDRGRRVALLARMGRNGHDFIPVSVADLDEALDTDGGTPGPTLRGLLRTLGGQDADLTTHFAVAIGFVDAAWARPGTIPHRLEIGKVIADSLLGAHLERRADLVSRLFANPDEWPRALRLAGRSD